MNEHDFIRKNRDAVNAFDTSYNQVFASIYQGTHRADLLKAWMACWRTQLPSAPTKAIVKKAWNGMPMCGKRIKHYPFHQSKDAATCALPCMKGKTHCWRHPPKPPEWDSEYYDE